MNLTQLKYIFGKLSANWTKLGCAVLLSILMVSCGTKVTKINPSVTTTAITPMSIVTTLPAATLDPKVALRENIIQMLSADNGKLPRLTKISYSTPEAGDITITWVVNGNVLQDSTKANAQIDATNILKVLENSKTRFIYVILIGTISIQDKYGNATEMRALSLGFNKSKLDKINWEDFRPSDIYNLADVVDEKW